jgi:hypothetical protein
MDDDVLTAALNGMPHEVAGVECDGCIVVRSSGDVAELVCNECATVVGTIDRSVLRTMLGLDAVRVVCPQCGAEHLAPGADQLFAYVCPNCGAGIEVTQPANPS